MDSIVGWLRGVGEGWREGGRGARGRELEVRGGGKLKGRCIVGVV